MILEASTGRNNFYSNVLIPKILVGYFLRIEVARSQIGNNLSQRKYVVDILEETGLLGSQPVDTLMDPH